MNTSTSITPSTPVEALRHLEQLQQRLDELQRDLESQSHRARMGLHMAMLCHEINNAFTPLVARAQLQLSESSTGDLARSVLITSDRIQSITALLLEAIATPNHSKHACHNLESSIRRVVEDMRLSLAHRQPNIRYTCTTDARAQIDERLLELILFNLVLNAANAATSNPDIRIETVATSIRPSDCSTWNINDSNQRFQLLPNGRIAAWRISIHDNGPGMSAMRPARTLQETQTRPRTPATGYGLGLAICETILHRFGSQIKIDKTDASGTLISVIVPAA